MDDIAAREAEAPAADRPRRIGDVVHAALADSVDRLVRQDAVLRAHADSDSVHDARVAVRRLRSDLRTFLPVLGAERARELRERLRRLQDGFSAARDADVLLARLYRDAEDLAELETSAAEETLAPLRDERDAAYARMREMLDDPSYAALLRDLADMTEQSSLGGAAEELACDFVPRIVRDAWSALRKRVRKRSRPPTDQELHRIRIAAKRVRYAVEALTPVAGRRARSLARALENLQTVLGDQHDAVVARERMRALAGDPQRAFVAGALAALEHRAATDGRGAWRKAWRRAKRALRALRRAL
ncbi:MAG TPA: CHAD domain-containing protein [Candidatus Elarobacter sp.]|nr:CHAD domain-containing protein [Candidatus Elarobacter sp.]